MELETLRQRIIMLNLENDDLKEKLAAAQNRIDGLENMLDENWVTHQDIVRCRKELDKYQSTHEGGNDL